MVKKICYTYIMKYKIAILDNISLLTEAQEQLNELATDSLVFPRNSEITKSELIKRTGTARGNSY